MVFTKAWLVSVSPTCALGVFTLRVIVLLLPGFRLGNCHVSVAPPLLVEVGLGLAALSVVLPGRLSVTVMPVSGTLPVLV